MKRIDFNDQWRLESRESFLEGLGEVTASDTFRLPHDGMLSSQRRQDSSNGPDCAWYDGDTYLYTKEFHIPEEWQGKKLLLEFEGVFQNPVVFVNGQFAGTNANGYTGFFLPIHSFLRYGLQNQVTVKAHGGLPRCSRWYTGGGIYRPVWLLVGDTVHLHEDGPRVETLSLRADRAVVRVRVPVCSLSVGQESCRVRLQVQDAEGTVVARDDQPLTLLGAETRWVSSQMDIPCPRLWEVDQPHLYRLKVAVCHEGEAEETFVPFGLRTIQVSRGGGLRINGRQVKLRGACIHHDNGLLGAVSLKDAELRRIQRLKEAGFNAIRSAHNPASRYLLEACDEVGMLVMDELFDVWNQSKREHDYALFFQNNWQTDVRSMVRKDFNHPCVILYTIGNEIPETGTPAGAAQNRLMADFLRKADGTRPVVNCVNGLFSAMPRIREILGDVMGEERVTADDINELMSTFDEKLDQVMAHDLVAEITEETFAGVDVCGYNYMDARYVIDGQRYPNRIIVGSEATPAKVGTSWPLIRRLDYVLGEFCWTGWDYLGEAGVGKNDYQMTGQLYGPWPWYLAWCGDYDICGWRRPQSYYREIVYGLRKQPYVCVERPEYHGKPRQTSGWTWPDVVASWTWPGYEGKPVSVEVYTAGDRVELLCNGISLGTVPVGEEMPYKAVFSTVYQPGTLTAVAYKKGEKLGQMELMTLGESAGIRLIAETEFRPKGTDRLIYIDLELTDKQGRWSPARDAEVTLTFSGPVRLAGFGSADPTSTEGVHALRHRTFQGRALAVLRTTGERGEVRVSATAPGLSSGTLILPEEA